MIRRLKELSMLVAAVTVLATIVVVSGIVPIKASSGHWPITRWLLDFASNRSVNLHSYGIKVPALDEPGMVRLGAATFDNNCRWCHGSPGHAQPPVTAQMTPHPPALSEAVQEWDDAELFYLIKHGIKFTGMPAWPTQNRDEDIWPVVAFLRELRSIDAASYLDLIQPKYEAQVNESTLVFSLAQSCNTCHDLGNNGSISVRVPGLLGQNEAYLRNSLLAYKTKARHSGVMMPIAHLLTDQQIDELASYYAEQTLDPPRLLDSRHSDLVEQGRVLAHQGDQSAKIPSCVDCHGPGEILRSDEYPMLAGQPAWYIRHQLELFATERRGGSDNSSLMHPIANKLDESQRRALAEYYASLNANSEN